jgi:molybdopterin synthase catalytic subunit
VIRIQERPIEVAELVEEVRGDGDGAVELFLGTVRDHNAGKRVIRLEYHAYPGMAEREMEKLERVAIDRFGVSRVAIVHRTGTLEIGDVSVAIAVASPHRAQAQQACKFLIDTLKETVPIWKKEFFEGGTVWIEGDDRSDAN